MDRGFCYIQHTYRPTYHSWPAQNVLLHGLIFLLAAAMGETKSTKNKSVQLRALGSVTAEFQVRHRWRTTAVFSGCYACTAEHLQARSLQKLFFFFFFFSGASGWACFLHARVRQCTVTMFNVQLDVQG